MSQTAEEEEEGSLKVCRRGVIIPAGQVAWVKCQVPPKLAQWDLVDLFEPQEDNAHLRHLDIGEGLLKIPNKDNSCISIPVGIIQAVT